MQILSHRNDAIVVGAPGVGKTTSVPPALLDAPWNTAKVLLVEPRRVAALAAAQRMAAQRREKLGTTVGLRMRDNTVVSDRTRLEVVTDGVLMAMIESDPALTGISVVVLDEFHERSLDVDVALALLLDIRDHLRTDLRVVVMSATLDVDTVAVVLCPTDPAPVIEIAAPRFPVTVVHRPAGSDMVAAATDAALAALDERLGDVLVFLPGVGEIRRTQRRIEQRMGLRRVAVLALHGRQDAGANALALAPSSADQRRIVLATTIAQTSVTIDGVTTVIDSGRQRAPRRDPGTGLTRLATVAVSVATADQRSGRAGRTGPGTSVRLWSSTQERSMDQRDRPEIADADLANLALQLSVWGTGENELRWCDPPPPQSMVDGRTVLTRLGALDHTGRVTSHGRALARLPLDVRLANLIHSDDSHHAELGMILAVVVSESAPYMGPAPADVKRRVTDLFGSALAGVSNEDLDTVLVNQVLRVHTELRRRLGHRHPLITVPALNNCGHLLALSFSDRVAVHSTDRPGTYDMAGGVQLRLPPGDPLTGEPLLVAVDVDGDRRTGVIRLAAAVTLADLRNAIPDLLRAERQVTMDGHTTDDHTVSASEVITLNGLSLHRQMVTPTAADIADAVRQYVASMGLGILNWTNSALRDRARLEQAHLLHPTLWPPMDDDALLGALDAWLGEELRLYPTPRIATMDTGRALLRLADAAGGRRALDGLFPVEVRLGSGVVRKVHYELGHQPKVATALRDLYGATAGPMLGNGRVAAVLEVLSPAGRPIAITDNLTRFWTVGYPAVRRDMRGRYPKHHWPTDPTATPPSRDVQR